MFLNHWAALHTHLSSASTLAANRELDAPRLQQQASDAIRSGSACGSDSATIRHLMSLPRPCHDRSLLDVSRSPHAAEGTTAPSTLTPPLPPTVRRAPTFSIHARAKPKPQATEKKLRMAQGSQGGSGAGSSDSLFVPSLQCLSLQRVPAPSIPKAIKTVGMRSTMFGALIACCTDDGSA